MSALPWQRDQDFYLLSWELAAMMSSIYGPLKSKQPHTCLQLLNPQRFFNVHVFFFPQTEKKKSGKKKEEKVKIKSSCSLKPSLCGGLFQEKPQKKITGSDCSPLTTERNHTHTPPITNSTTRTCRSPADQNLTKAEPESRTQTEPD